MASQNFNDAIRSSQKMTVIAPDGREYSGYYADPRVDRETLPQDWEAYDIRHDDDGCGIFVQLCHNYVFVNNAGTFFTQTKIPELKDEGSYIIFAIDPEEWQQVHTSKEPCPPNDPTDWEWTF